MHSISNMPSYTFSTVVLIVVATIFMCVCVLSVFAFELEYFDNFQIFFFHKYRL